MEASANDVSEAVVVAFRTQWRHIVAAVMRFSDDWDVAEECAQDAFAKALDRWPTHGIPDRPAAWLTATARNRAIDRRRRDARGNDKLIELARQSHHEYPVDTSEEADADVIPDDRLRLIFACCHPALPLEAGIALALRTLAGLSTSAIARAFLVSEMTVSKRLVRAKTRIRRGRLPLRLPPRHMLGDRADAVVGVLHLMFNEGHSAPANSEPARRELCLEAIRLARLLVELMPDEAGARRLLALMLSRNERAGTEMP